MSYAIISDTPDPLDNENLFWSNEQGWVSLDEADVYEEVDDMSLPIGGEWFQL